MTAARAGRADVAEQVEQQFGRRVAQRLDTFDDGTLHVTAGSLTRLLSWLVDFVFYLFCAAVAIVVFVLVSRDSGISESANALAMLGLLAGVPIVYGLFYGNGRAIGAMVTKTRLVRVKDGGRIGLGACWAMYVRVVLFPLLLLAMLASGAGGSGALRRTSIDDRATRRLHEAGFTRR
ncbi:RDD family protein [Lentzea fradiae]|uniref:RDD family protein n=1 Tax=Lentzea fradiae TaxID=200378 RepID=A0A1G7ULG8_9PSEU|nr:RDD family protein [Lentzea fradiae]SDG48412.1 RDD family protein [Lentzea fradiae]